MRGSQHDMHANTFYICKCALVTGTGVVGGFGGTVIAKGNRRVESQFDVRKSKPRKEAKMCMESFIIPEHILIKTTTKLHISRS